MNRREFFTKTLGITASLALTGSISPESTVEEIPIDLLPGPLVFKNVTELICYQIDREIDYEMISRMLRIVDPTKEIAPLKELAHGKDYVIVGA